MLAWAHHQKWTFRRYWFILFISLCVLITAVTTLKGNGLLLANALLFMMHCGYTELCYAVQGIIILIPKSDNTTKWHPMYWAIQLVGGDFRQPKRLLLRIKTVISMNIGWHNLQKEILVEWKLSVQNCMVVQGMNLLWMNLLSITKINK